VELLSLRQLSLSRQLEDLDSRRQKQRLPQLWMFVGLMSLPSFK
jgi:hypothetical protein